MGRGRGQFSFLKAMSLLSCVSFNILSLKIPLAWVIVNSVMPS